MEASTLAQQFNDVSDSLHTRGHRVIVRRVRSFLEAGDTLGAETFLTRAKESLGNSDAGVGALAQSLKGFAAEGGDVSRLVTDPAWVEGTARESRLGRMVDASVGGQDLGGLADQLARQQSALAAGEPLAKVPARQMAPSALPPLPKSAPAGEDSRSPVGNIFANQRRPRAVIEALADLEPKPLDLDDQGDAGHDDETPELRPAAPEVPERGGARSARQADAGQLRAFARADRGGRPRGRTAGGREGSCGVPAGPASHDRAGAAGAEPPP